MKILLRTVQIDVCHPRCLLHIFNFDVQCSPSDWQVVCTYIYSFIIVISTFYRICVTAMIAFVSCFQFCFWWDYHILAFQLSSQNSNSWQSNTNLNRILKTLVDKVKSKTLSRATWQTDNWNISIIQNILKNIIFGN